MERVGFLYYSRGWIGLNLKKKLGFFPMTSPFSKMMRYSMSQQYSPFPWFNPEVWQMPNELQLWDPNTMAEDPLQQFWKNPFFVWGKGFLMYSCYGLGVKRTHFGKLSAIWDPGVFPVQIIGNPKKRNLFSKVLLTSIFPLENDSFLIFQCFCEYQSVVFLFSK